VRKTTFSRKSRVSVSSIQDWKTKQRQLADYTKAVQRAKQRTLFDFLPKEEVEDDKWPKLHWTP